MRNNHSPPGTTAIDIADIGLGNDGDFGGLVAGRSGGSNGQECGDNELNHFHNK